MISPSKFAPVGLMVALVLSGGALSACTGTANPPQDGSVDAAMPPTDAGLDAAADVAPMDTAPTDVAPVDVPQTDAPTGDAMADVPTSWPDSSTTTPPDWVSLRVGGAGSCPAFTACGGDVVGTWDTSNACFEIDIESAIRGCPGAMVTRRTGRGRGRVVFGRDGLARRVADAEVEAAIFVPAVCAAIVSCATLQGLLAPLATEATCTPDATGGCNCIARQITHIDQADAYRIEGNEIVGVVSGKRWQFCIAGDRLTYRDTSPTGPREPGTIELRRR